MGPSWAHRGPVVSVVVGLSCLSRRGLVVDRPGPVVVSPEAQIGDAKSKSCRQHVTYVYPPTAKMSALSLSLEF